MKQIYEHIKHRGRRIALYAAILIAVVLIAAWAFSYRENFFTDLHYFPDEYILIIDLPSAHDKYNAWIESESTTCRWLRHRSYQLGHRESRAYFGWNPDDLDVGILGFTPALCPNPYGYPTWVLELILPTLFLATFAGSLIVALALQFRYRREKRRPAPYAGIAFTIAAAAVLVIALMLAQTRFDPDLQLWAMPFKVIAWVFGVYPALIFLLAAPFGFIGTLITVAYIRAMCRRRGNERQAADPEAAPLVPKDEVLT